MKKNGLLVLTLIMAFCMLVGCNKKSPTTETQSVSRQTQAPVQQIPVQAQGPISQNEWPDNQFTRLVTKPNFTISSVDVSIYMGEGDCSITFTDVTVEQLKAYAQTLIADGFKYHTEEVTDMTGTYQFRAGNVESGDGFMVNIVKDIWSDNYELKITSAAFG
ncbi:MAG: hypothetical protein LBJ31_12170 [Treponema sp.]|jgi:hypothetical protein|nr:hypothetical protein [Treponema sp.]